MNYSKLVPLLFLMLLPVAFCGIISDTLNLGKKTQRLTVKGTLLCGKEPAAGVNVKLLDLDPGFDDEMARNVTNKNGEFILDGTEEERTPIDGILKIYHDCDDLLPCNRRWKIKIPSDYITYGDTKQPNNKVLDIGTWNLQVRLHEEDRDCYH